MPFNSLEYIVFGLKPTTLFPAYCPDAIGRFPAYCPDAIGRIQGLEFKQKLCVCVCIGNSCYIWHTVRADDYQSDLVSVYMKTIQLYKYTNWAQQWAWDNSL